MQKIDLQIVSIPDHEAQLEIARLIVGGNHTISMQTAIEMAKNPPIVLFHNMDVKDVKQYLNTFERLGIAFKVKILEDAPADAHNDPPKPDAHSPERHAAAEDAQKSAGAHKNLQPADNPQESAGAHHNLQAADDSRESTNTDQDPQIPDDTPEPANASQDHTAPDDPQAPDGTNGNPEDDSMMEFAGIKAHNSTIDRGAAQPDDTGSHDHTAHPLHTPLYAASGPRHTAGIRVGDIGIERLAKIEQASKKKSLMITSIITGIIIILGVTVLFLPKKNKFMVSASTASLIKKEKKKPAAKPPKSAPATAAAPARQNSGNQRNSVSNQQKQQASAYVDSAKASAGDRKNSIAFYKIAISFNRYNLPAWHGLLQAYREEGQEAEANEALEQMTSIFGNEVMSITAIVKPFGDLLDAYMTGDGTYRIEYKTRKLAKDDVLREVFNMTRAVRSACACKNISIYAVTGTGKGLLAHSTQETSIHTLPAFSKHAEIVWLE
jgi:flagellar basal body-associated protein FliL